MREITYICNLCQDRCECAAVVGLSWRPSFLSPRGWEVKRPSECNAHLCQDCLRAIQALKEEA